MVALAERKLSDRTPAFPVVEAPPQIMLDPRRSLVALLWRLREQLHDEAASWAEFLRDLPFGGAGFLAMWQCTHSIGSLALKGRVPVSA